MPLPFGYTWSNGVKQAIILIERVGLIPVGHGQMAFTVNNVMHVRAKLDFKIKLPAGTLKFGVGWTRSRKA